MNSAERDLLFRGTRGPTASSAALVVVEDAASGAVLGPLEHRVRYSPTGLNWGYDGAGPRDLARSLLAAVLADAHCGVCRGAPTGCDSCHGGLRPDLPAAAFTYEVVARLAPDWSMHARQVQAWWERQRRDHEPDRPVPTHLDGQPREHR